MLSKSEPSKLVAEKIGRQVGMPARSLTLEEAGTHFGDLAIWVTGGGSVSSEKTRAVLQREPREVDLITEFDRLDYYGSRKQNVKS